MHKKKTVALLLFLIAFLFGLYIYFKEERINYTPTTYEKELISYFNEIALQSEYDDNPQRIIKWKESMILFVLKEGEFKDQMSVINKTIDEINRLATDGFKIVLTDNVSESNSILFLCSKEKVAELSPNFYEMLNDDIDYDISGLAYSGFSNKNYAIDESLIFINSEFSLDIQGATILEEITQSLGLAFDSNLYSNSIFYQNKFEQDVRIKQYSQLDMDIVRLLYHPKMKPGLDSVEVERVIKRILKSEKD